jgi:DHA2 family multidrug resistance protein-like MFS transporter
MNAALVRATYPASMLGRGIGYNAMVLSLSAAIGPTLAALILSVAPWPWLFLINLPIGIAALMVGRKSLPDPHGHGQPFDWPSALLSAAMMGLIVFGAEMAAREGSALGLAMVAGGLLAGAGLVVREWRVPRPLIPLDLLRIPIFSLSIAASIVSFAAQALAYVAIPFLLQSVLGRSVFETGLLMTPWPIGVGIAAPIAGRLADRVPAGMLGGLGLAIFAAGLFFLSRLGASPDNFSIAWRMAVCGIGFGMFQSPNNRVIVSAAPKPRSGAAGGMLATARLLGQTTGVVTVGAAFHLFGVAVAPHLLFAASLAALLAGAISLSRLGVSPPARVAVYRPILD